MANEVLDSSTSTEESPNITVIFVGRSPLIDSVDAFAVMGALIVWFQLMLLPQSNQTLVIKLFFSAALLRLTLLCYTFAFSLCPAVRCSGYNLICGGCFAF